MLWNSYKEKSASRAQAARHGVKPSTPHPQFTSTDKDKRQGASAALKPHGLSFSQFTLRHNSSVKNPAPSPGPSDPLEGFNSPLKDVS